MGDVQRYDGEIQNALQVYPQVPEAWLRAVIGAETSYNDVLQDTWEPNAGDFSYGPMQVLMSTARGLGYDVTPAELRSPAINILVGAALIASLLNTAGGHFERMYSAYNSGSADRYLSSDQVRSNVERALTWLGQFQTPAIAGAGLVLVAILGVLWVGPRLKSIL